MVLFIPLHPNPWCIFHSLMMMEHPVITDMTVTPDVSSHLVYWLSVIGGWMGCGVLHGTKAISARCQGLRDYFGNTSSEWPWVHCRIWHDVMLNSLFSNCATSYVIFMMFMMMPRHGKTFCITELYGRFCLKHDIMILVHYVFIPITTWRLCQNWLVCWILS